MEKTLIRQVRVGGVPEHFNLPWQMAIADNAFDEISADVHYTDVPGGTGELTRALRDGELDVALVLTEGAVLDILQNGGNCLVKVFVDSPLTWGIHVAYHSEITDVKGIRGKRIAISRYGSGSHLIAVVDAAERGWSTADMSFVVVDNLNGARKALAASKADVFLWERHMTQPYVDNGEFRRVGERQVPWPAFVVSVRRDFVSRNASVLRGMLDIVARYAGNVKRRKSSAALIASTYGLQRADAERWLADVRWGTGYRRPLAALQRVHRALSAQGVIESSHFDADQVWHRIT